MKQFVCNFKINDNIYEIYIVDEIKGKLTYVGETNYDDKEVYIEDGKLKNMIDTLIHELMHVWLYENGHKNQDNGCFNYEQICEFTAQSFNFIQKVRNDFFFNL